LVFLAGEAGVLQRYLPEGEIGGRIKAGRPQTIGHVEALHKTILDEGWRPSFVRFLMPRFSGLRGDLDEYLELYNFRRARTGRLTRGAVPADLVYGARKMEPR
jgi:hypothetical protein